MLGDSKTEGNQPPQQSGKRSSEFSVFVTAFRFFRNEANVACFLPLFPSRINHNFEEKYYEDSRVDAVAMERLAASSNVADIYGFCGLTVVQEYAGRELAQMVDGRKVKPMDKLRLAKQIAQGVADIHSILGDDGESGPPSLVNNDINPSNLLFTDDGRAVFNDFNIAILVMKNKKTGDTCPFYSRFPNPQWKAPEEQVVPGETQTPIVDSKIDIYALGNLFFRMIAGSGPWKRPEAEKLAPKEKKDVALLKSYNGTMPMLPEEIRSSREPAIVALSGAMRLCYSFDPADRPTATEIVSFLDHAISSIEQWMKGSTRTVATTR